MIQKPPRWNVSPALLAPEGRALWRGVAYFAPFWAGARIGGPGLLLGPNGAPLTGGISLTAGSTAEQRATPYGFGIGISGASNLLQRNDYEPLITSDGAGTGDFTVLVLANPVSESTVRMALSQTDSAVGGGAFVMFNTTGAPSTATAGAVSLRTRDGAGSTDVSATSVLDGDYHLFVVRRLAGVLTMWVDGVQRGSNSGTVRAIIDGTLGFAIGQRAEGTANRINTSTSIVLEAGWNRGISDASIRLLARDPFIMIRPYAEWRGVWTPLGALLSAASAWRIGARQAGASAWKIAARASKAAAWRILGRASRASAWRILNRASRASAWRILARLSRASTWRILARAARDTAWEILAAGGHLVQAVAWRIATRTSKSSAWRILARAQRQAAWRILRRTQKTSAWRIIARMARASAWRIGARAIRAGAWRILARTAQAAGWRIGEEAVPPPAVIMKARATPRILRALENVRIIKVKPQDRV